jgi:xylulokinase
MYLGIDCSTQSMSGMLYDSLTHKIVSEISIEFKTRFPAFAFSGNSETAERVVNPLLWVLALDELLSEFKKTGVNFSDIKGIGGAAQQHATVYLNEHFQKPWAWKSDLCETVKPMLSMERSPIWMDQSTALECLEINKEMPEAEYALRISGSVITQRFSGPQIRLFAKLFPRAYANTKVIHLLSSFLTCLLVGKDSSIDLSDASGMNLLNLNTLNWDTTLVQATQENLKIKLPSLIDGNHIAGKIAPYFVNKYGFTPKASVVFFTGDNISSALGIGCNDSSIAVISLGTSDTMFIYNSDFNITSKTCNTFYHPNGGYISLLCIQNGAFSRDKVRNSVGCNWEEFDNLLSKTEAGNNGIIQLPFFSAEINPHLPQGSVLSNIDRTLNPTERIRAVLEAQAINLKFQSKTFCQNLNKIIVTGGGSNSNGFCQIIANVFQCEVLRVTSANTAQLGGIARAISVLKNETVKAIDEVKITTKPNKETKETYLQLQKSFERLLQNM